MKLQQRILLVAFALLSVWIMMSIFKVHIKIEILKKDNYNQRVKFAERKEENILVSPYNGKKNLAPIYVPWSDYKEPYKNEMEEKLHDSYRFNKYLSDRLPLNRDVDDTRPRMCLSQKYPKYMGKVSVVLISYNEAVSVVFRTIYSVINRSPSYLLHEFILYDDGSIWEESIGPMKAEAEKVKEVPVRFIRNETRGGLMRARTSAAKYATGDIMVYLDSHCEVLPGWLEPLIEPIYKDYTAVTCPVIDTIDWKSMNIMSDNHPISSMGSYNILLNYNWYPIPSYEQQRRKKEHGGNWAISPIRSPAMAGGLFAISRKYFHELGEYDTQMNVWGGENTEISIRIWTCGGSLLFTPCSKVAHVFRHGYPYDFQGDHFETVLFNYKRVAKVWLDEDEDFYYHLRPMARNKDVGDISERVELRRRLQCKPYKWFVRNIAPNLILKEDIKFFGQLKNEYHQNYCVDNLGNDSKGAGLHIGTYPCHPSDGAIDNQIVIFSKEGMLRTIDKCINLNYEGALTLNYCYDYQPELYQWEYDVQTKVVRHIHTGKCLDAGEKPMSTKIKAENCNNSARQRWTFTYSYI